MRKSCWSIAAGSRNAAIDRAEDAQTLETTNHGWTVNTGIRLADGLDKSAPVVHAWRIHAVLQRNVRHDVARRGLGGYGDMSHPLPLRPSPLLMKHGPAREHLCKLGLACEKFLDLLLVNRHATLENDGVDAMLNNSHYKFVAIRIVLGGEHRHERVNLGRTGRKVGGRRAADEGAVRVRMSVLIADLGLLLLLEASAALDLALLEPDGDSVEPDGDVGTVLALRSECDLVSSDELAWVVQHTSGRPRGCTSLVLFVRDLLYHVIGRDFSSTREVNIKQGEITSLENHAQLAMNRISRSERIVSVKLRRSLLFTAHESNNAQFLEMGQLLGAINDGMPAFFGEDGYALVTNERVSINPVTLRNRHAPHSIIDGDAPTECPGERRPAVFPDTLRNEKILLMDGTLSMGG